MESNHVTDSNTKPNDSNNSETISISKSINDTINDWLNNLKENTFTCSKCKSSLINSGAFLVNGSSYCPDCFNTILKDKNSEIFDDFVD